MGMTITQKILAEHAGKNTVSPGELINAKLDVILANDVTAPIAIKEFKKTGAKNVFDKDKLVFVPDHFTPNKDIDSAGQCKLLRDFAREQDITNYFEVGKMGVEHALLPEQGIVLPGDLIIGADSHTCTYGALGAFSTGVGSTDVAAAMITGEAWFKVPPTIKFVYKGSLNKWVSGKDLILYTIGDIGVDGALYCAMEFTGEVISALPMSGRFTMANMAIEAGAKNGIIQPDETTKKYVESRANREFKFFYSDPDAEYLKVIEYDCTKIEPQVACPHLPENTKPVGEVSDIEIDQVVIGSCTNGRLDDLRQVPATQKIYKDAMKEGLIDIFIDAGAAVSTPTCGPCLGGHMGVLAKGERAVATTNRNFVGRMGDPESEVYLTNPVIAAASAITGRISSPDDI
jgi:3-isopropylmalate/(R)-2-methylmalate dehydratase large subunit